MVKCAYCDEPAVYFSVKNISIPVCVKHYGSIFAWLAQGNSFSTYTYIKPGEIQPCCVCGEDGLYRRRFGDVYCDRHIRQMQRNGYIVAKDNRRNKSNFYTILDDRVEIEVYSQHKKFVVIIDLEDLERVSTRNWYIIKYGAPKYDYAYIIGAASMIYKPKKTAILLKKFVLDLDIPRTTHIICKNGNNLDYRKDNLMVIDRKDSYVRKAIPESTE